MSRTGTVRKAAPPRLPLNEPELRPSFRRERRWLKRGDYYEPFIRSVLRSYGVPTDLYYLGMIESAFLPTARSRAGAVGFWQFMPSTGRGVGLRIDSLVDERMDPVRTTRAAAPVRRSEW